MRPLEVGQRVRVGGHPATVRWGCGPEQVRGPSLKAWRVNCAQEGRWLC